MTFITDIIANVPELSTLEFFLLCLASFFTSTITAAFGLGGGAMLIIIMVSFMNPLVIIPIHAVIQMSSNISRALMLWRHITFSYMTPFVIGTIIGVTIGGQIIVDLPKYLLQSFIGIFILYSLYGPIANNVKASNIKFIGLGTFSSFVTMFVGGTGPIIAPFIRAITNERRATVATHAAFMTWKHGVKIITFGLLGFSFSDFFPLIIGMILFGIIGTWAGKIILIWMPEKVFAKAFNFVLTFLALRLLYEGLRQII